MEEPILEYLRRRLNASKGEWPRIAEVTKLPYDTVAKVAQGERPNPTLKVVQPLMDYFREFDAMVDRVRSGADKQAIAG